MISVFEKYLEGRRSRGILLREPSAAVDLDSPSLHASMNRCTVIPISKRHLDDEYDRPEEIDRCLAVFDVFNQELANDETKTQVLQ